MLSGKQDLIKFGEANPSSYCYFHIFFFFETLCSENSITCGYAIRQHGSSAFSYYSVCTIFSTLRILAAEI